MRTDRLVGLSLLLVLSALPGCTPHACLPEGPLANGLGAYPSLAAHEPEVPASDSALCTTVSTVLHPEAAQRHISLQECIALALENGRVGGTSIRVLAYDPAINFTAIEESLGRFDTRWLTSMGWSTVDELAGNVLASVPLGVGLTAVPSATGVGTGVGVGPGSTAAINNLMGVNNVNGAAFASTLEKPLSTGGVAGITFLTDYTLVNQPPVDPGTLNPTYRPRLIFSLEQPLLRGFGTTINQVPILIARVSFDQEREKFAGAVDQLLFGVESAYWDLYFAYWNLFTQDSALRQAHDAWQIAKQLQEKKLVSVQDLAALDLRYQSLRLARLEALGGQGKSILEAERKLRFVVGLPPEDGNRLVPTDTPTTAAYLPDWQAAATAALNNRPELAQLRQEIKKVHLDIKRLKNNTLPDLRAVGSYDINGLGSRLDGPNGDTNALRSLASDHFNNWSVGMILDVPIGARIANSQLRRAELVLAQRMAQLRDQEKQAIFALQESYRDLLRAQEAVRIEANIRKAATERYQALYDLFRAGLEGPNFLLIAQQDWIASNAAAQASIFAYNTAIARFELDKGTIQTFDHVSIADGPLPACVQSRASAHISERQRALVLRENPDAALEHGAPLCADGATASGLATGSSPPPLATLGLDQALSPDGADAFHAAPAAPRSQVSPRVQAGLGLPSVLPPAAR